MALAAARDVGIDVRPGTGLPIIALAKERDSEAVTGGGGGATEIARRRRRRRPRRSTPEPRRADARRAGREAGQERTTGRDGKRPDRVFLPNAKDRDPDPAQQRGDVRAGAPARRGAPVRGGLPPRPAPAADAALGAVGHRGHRRPPASASCCGTSAACGRSATPRSRTWWRCRAWVKKAAEAVRAYFDAHGELAAPPVSAASEAPAPRPRRTPSSRPSRRWIPTDSPPDSAFHLRPGRLMTHGEAERYKRPPTRPIGGTSMMNRLALWRCASAVRRCDRRLRRRRGGRLRRVRRRLGVLDAEHCDASLPDGSAPNAR